ncbi:hypothetical protein MRX96_039607 [Rhipicephalus microplus]
MLKKYGGSVVCLDVMHKTSGYALPLFLLVVKTPSGYTPAGVFIIQFEMAHCIAEALDVFKQWCHNWSPQYWMVQYIVDSPCCQVIRKLDDAVFF